MVYKFSWVTQQHFCAGLWEQGTLLGCTNSPSFPEEHVRIITSPSPPESPCLWEPSSPQNQNAHRPTIPLFLGMLWMSEICLRAGKHLQDPQICPLWWRNSCLRLCLLNRNSAKSLCSEDLVVTCRCNPCYICICIFPWFRKIVCDQKAWHIITMIEFCIHLLNGTCGENSSSAINFVVFVAPPQCQNLVKNHIGIKRSLRVDSYMRFFTKFRMSKIMSFCLLHTLLKGCIVHQRNHIDYRIQH